MATDLTSRILDVLSRSDDSISSQDAFPSLPSETIGAALKSLHSRDMIVYSQRSRDEASLTKEGEIVAAEGSHEAKVFEAVQKAVEGLMITDLPTTLLEVPNIISAQEIANNGKAKALKERWIVKDKDVFKANVQSITDKTREDLIAFQKEPEIKKTQVNLAKDLKKRNLVIIQKVTFYEFGKGPKFSKELVKEETDLTADMLASGTWKTVKLKPYNFKAKGALPESGALHPLNKVRHEFRQIFFEMGFQEMPTNCYVETGFWNFDALFIPQQHPARDVQDTFFIADPLRAEKPRWPQNFHTPQQQHLPNGDTAQEPIDNKEIMYDEQYWENVKKTHEIGDYGSTGYRYPWKEDESLRLVLRTHTTATSTYMLRQLASDPRPARYFSIDRVFRNESVDATHLAEFHQVEGVIADWDLSLGGLIGFMEVFFAKMGILNLRFKPAYNPYTEPSLEIFSYHPGLHKWVEIGNSGMFRPEMLEPMGLPSNMRVYGWGLSLERPTMIKYGVKNIRELLGHKVDLNFIETNPAVRLEKD